MKAKLTVWTSALVLSAACSASNSTTTIFILARPDAQPYTSLFGSVIDADKDAATYYIDCRTDIPSTSECTEHGATITAGPSVIAYHTSIDGTSKLVSCTQNQHDQAFTCSHYTSAVGLGDTSSINTIPADKLRQEAQLIITAGAEKLTALATPTPTAKSEARTKIKYCIETGYITRIIILLFLCSWVF